jgi:hypothetical protein
MEYYSDPIVIDALMERLEVGCGSFRFFNSLGIRAVSLV